MADKSRLEVVKVLQQIPILQRLSTEDCLKLANAFEVQIFPKNSTIIRENDPADGLYIIHKGEVKVLKNKVGGSTASALSVPRAGTSRFGSKIASQSNSKVDADYTVIATLGVTDYFGESALMNDAPRSASCKAMTEVCVFFMSKFNFSRLIGENKVNIQFAKRVAVVTNTEKAKPGNMYVDMTKKPNVSQIGMLRRAFRENQLFQNFSEHTQSALMEEMHPCAIPANTVVIYEKQIDGDACFIIESGHFVVEKNGQTVNTQGMGSLFGELAQFHECPRNATIKATQPSVIWQLTRKTFKLATKRITESIIKDMYELLCRVEIQKPLTNQEKRLIAENCDFLTVTAGTTLFREGDEADSAYIIKSGVFGVHKKHVRIAEVRENGVIGERGLFQDEVRNASVFAEQDCVLLRIRRKEFLLLLGPLESQQQRKITQQDEAVCVQAEDTETVISPEKVVVSTGLPKMEELGVLGFGACAVVNLVKFSETNQIYAVKRVDKAQVEEQGLHERLVQERLCHMACSGGEHIQKLYRTQKCQDSVYFVTEPCLGGDLYTLLKSRGTFREEQASFYIKRLLLALEHVHNQGIMFRDLKPENVLISNTGTPVLADFGAAKKSTQSYSVVGTVDYLPPEQILGTGHTAGVDFWQIGILTYELLHGYPPFLDDNPLKTYEKILAGVFDIQAFQSEEAAGFLRMQLRRKPAKRLGCMHGGVKLALLHKWLQMPEEIPFIPKLNSNTDLAYISPSVSLPDRKPFVGTTTNDWDHDF